MICIDHCNFIQRTCASLDFCMSSGAGRGGGVVLEPTPPQILRENLVNFGEIQNYNTTYC